MKLYIICRVFQFSDTDAYQSVVLAFKSTPVEMIFYRPKTSLQSVLEFVLDHVSIA